MNKKIILILLTVLITIIIAVSALLFVRKDKSDVKEKEVNSSPEIEVTVDGGGESSGLVKEEDVHNREEMINEFSDKDKQNEKEFDIDIFDVKNLTDKKLFRYNLDGLKYAFMAYDYNLLVNGRKVEEMLEATVTDEQVLAEDSQHTSLSELVRTMVNVDREALFRYIKFGVLYKIKDFEMHRITPEELLEEINKNGALLVVPKGEDVKKFIKQRSMSRIASIKTDIAYEDLNVYYEDIATLILLEKIDKERYDKLVKEESFNKEAVSLAKKYSLVLEKMMED